MSGGKIYYKEGFKYQLTRTFGLECGIIAPRGGIHTDFLSLDDSGMLTVFRGYAWDGASGPTIDTPSSMRGSLVHDSLYQLMRMGFIAESYRDEADDLLRRLCLADGMNHVRAEIWAKMVAEFAGRYARYGTERKELVAP